MAFEALPEYVAASAFRFLDKGMGPEQMRDLYDRIATGGQVCIEKFRKQGELAL
jgi:site-specific DNA-methyltransferase (cytosine-N4-specific)